MNGALHAFILIPTLALLAPGDPLTASWDTPRAVELVEEGGRRFVADEILVVLDDWAARDSVVRQVETHGDVVLGAIPEVSHR